VLRNRSIDHLGHGARDRDSLVEMDRQPRAYRREETKHRFRGLGDAAVRFDELDGTGAAVPLVVKVPGAPTGAVFNGGPGFVVSHEGASGPSVFLFATEFGTIRGWNPNVPLPATSTRSFNVVNRHSGGAVYKGLAIATGTEGDLLYATDFAHGRVDVFDSAFNRVHRNDFVDPNMPSGYGPFGIQAINGTIFVTYAKQDPTSPDEVAGPGNGLGCVAGRAARDHAGARALLGHRVRLRESRGQAG